VSIGADDDDDGDAATAAVPSRALELLEEARKEEELQLEEEGKEAGKEAHAGDAPSSSSSEEEEEEEEEEGKEEEKDELDAAQDLLGVFGTYLTLWVLLCIGAGIALSQLLPSAALQQLNELKVGNVNVPIGVCLFFMMYPGLLNLELRELLHIVRAPLAILITLISNWIVAPVVGVFFAWLVLSNEQHKVAIILLSSSPCTAMVIVWSQIAGGSMEQTIVITSINTLSIVLFYAPLVKLLTGSQNVRIDTIELLISTAVFVGAPLVLALVSKAVLIRCKGTRWFRRVYVTHVQHVTAAMLLLTLVLLFALNGETLLKHPLELLRVSAALLPAFLVVVSLNLIVTHWARLGYAQAIVTVIIGSSSNFELAIAIAISLYGADSQAALASTMGLFWEVPLMLGLVKLGKRLAARGFFLDKRDRQHRVRHLAMESSLAPMYL
jgi:ACR3 family arsenite transporter